MKIILPYDVHRKIMFYVNNCDKEVGGMGRVVFDKATNSYIVKHAYLVEQEVGSAHTDLDASAVAKCEIETMNDEGYFNFWWHSHVNMQAFWSSVDTATIKDMGTKGLCVAVVFNKKKEHKGAIYAVSSDEHMPHVIEDNVKVMWEEPPMLESEALLAEIKLKVKERTFTHTTTTSNYSRNWQEQEQEQEQEDYALYDNWYSNTNTKKREVIATSRAWQSDTKKTLKMAVRDQKDYIIFCTKDKLLQFTCVELSKLSRDDIDTMIQQYDLLPAEKVELMSKWYYIPFSWEITKGASEQRSILNADM